MQDRKAAVKCAHEYKYKESIPLTDMRYISGQVESLPLTDMRYINDWAERKVLRRKARDFSVPGGLAYRADGFSYTCWALISLRIISISSTVKPEMIEAISSEG